MKYLIAVLAAVTVFLGLQVLDLKAEVQSLSRNTAIAILSAEAANNKIGAIAPYFSEDKEKFINAWLDTTNMPLAVLPESVIGPLKRELEDKRNSSEARKTRAAVFK